MIYLYHYTEVDLKMEYQMHMISDEIFSINITGTYSQIKIIESAVKTTQEIYGKFDEFLNEAYDDESGMVESSEEN